MKFGKLISFAVLSLGLFTLPSFSFASEADSVSDIQSMTLRSDGKYDVVCKSGKTEVVTIRQIHENDVCNSSPTPQPSPEVTAIFSRAEGDYYVLCVSHTWEIASSDAISSGNVCKTSVGQLPIGTWNLHYDWGCKGSFAETPFEIHSNGTFRMPKEGPPYTGKWTLVGNQYKHTFDQTSTVYTGTFDGQKKIKGTMAASSWKGCFELVFGQKSKRGRVALDSAGKN